MNRQTHITILIAVVAVTFANSLWNGFAWDDFRTIKFFQDFGFSRIFQPLANGVEYFPVRDLSFAIDVMFWGKNPFGYHLTNLILYMANVIMAYLFTAELWRANAAGTEPGRGDAMNIAFASSLLFAVHPVHCEPVNWISCRGSLFTGIFFFSSLLMYCGYLQREEDAIARRYWVSSLFCFILVMLSKQYGIILPLVLLILPTASCHRKLKARLIGVIPFFAVAAIGYLVNRKIAARVGILSTEKLTALKEQPAEIVARALQIPFFYLKKLLTPWTGYAAEYNAAFNKAVFAPETIAAFLGILGLASVAWFIRKRVAPLYIAIAFFFITLLPFLNYFLTHPVVSDRYAYLPSYAVCFMLAVASVKIPRIGQFSPHLPILLIMVFALAFTSFRQNRSWSSDASLWRNAVQVSPTAYACGNLGVYYFDNKQYKEAFALFDQARNLENGNLLYDYYKGVLEMQNGNLEGAVAIFSAVLVRQPDYYKAAGHLGFALDQLGRKQEAVEYYLKALKSRERKWEIAFNAANIRKSQARFAEALELFTLSLEISPGNPEIYNNLGLIQRELGNRPEAITLFEKAVTIDPNHQYALFNLAETYYQSGKVIESRRIFTGLAARFPALRKSIEPYISGTR